MLQNKKKDSDKERVENFKKKKVQRRINVRWKVLTSCKTAQIMYNSRRVEHIHFLFFWSHCLESTAAQLYKLMDLITDDNQLMIYSDIRTLWAKGIYLRLSSELILDLFMPKIQLGGQKNNY